MRSTSWPATPGADPAAAMLEVLDSAQNSTFRDHYLELPFDLSKVLFITTANNKETIPPPLLDRMDLLELGSYLDDEKFEIARRHLVQKQITACGLAPKAVNIPDDTLRAIISDYTREAGVRTRSGGLATSPQSGRPDRGGKQKTHQCDNPPAGQAAGPAQIPQGEPAAQGSDRCGQRHGLDGGGGRDALSGGACTQGDGKPGADWPDGGRDEGVGACRTHLYPRPCPGMGH